MHACLLAQDTESCIFGKPMLCHLHWLLVCFESALQGAINL